MRTTIPETKLVHCDRCGMPICGTPDLELRADHADRDYSGSIVYGHVNRYDFCLQCAYTYNKMFDSFIAKDLGLSKSVDKDATS